MNTMKETLCHFKRLINVEIFDFRVRQHKQNSKLFHMNVSDSLVLAPMGLFHPKLFCPLITPAHIQLVSEDIFDEEYMQEVDLRQFDSENKKGIAWQKMALDKAIVQSIMSHNRADVRRRLFSNILLVGGSSQIEGLVEVLEQKIATRIIPSDLDLEKVEIVKTLRKDLDPRFISWRGAAVLCALDSVKTECWLKHSDWEQFGISALKEKVPFVWSQQ